MPLHCVVTRPKFLNVQYFVFSKAMACLDEILDIQRQQFLVIFFASSWSLVLTSKLTYIARQRFAERELRPHIKEKKQ